MDPEPDEPELGAGHDEHPPADLMAIYLACDRAPGDTDTELQRFAQEFGQ